MSQTERRTGISGTVVSIATTGAMALAVAAAFWGQWRLDHRPGAASFATLAVAWAPLAAGAFVFALLAHREALEQKQAALAEGVRAPRWPALVAAVLLAGVSFPGFTGNEFRPLPTLELLAAIGFLWWAFWRRGERAEQNGATADATKPAGPPAVRGLHVSWTAITVLAIVAVGAFLRLYRLDILPREMGVDMPLKYANAQEIMNGQFMIFCPRYPGRESLFFYLIAVYGKVFGLSFFAIKFTCAALGIVTIPALYGLGRSLFNREVGLIAAAFLALNKWHIILSRSGYRSIMIPLLVIALIYLLARALRRGRGTDWVALGLVLGLGMYTYNSNLIVPPVLALAVLVEMLLLGRSAWRRFGWGLLATTLGALFAYLPLARYAIEQPEQYLYRVATRATGIEAPLPKDLIRTFLDNCYRALGLFNVRGDSVFYVNVPYQREMGMISGALFVVGLLYLFWRWRQGHNATVLVFLFGMIMPTALAVAFPQEVPNAVRASGVLGPACLLAALPVTLLGRRVSRLWHEGIKQPLLAQIQLPPRPAWRWNAQLRLNLRLFLGLFVVVLLGAELRESYRITFHDYVQTMWWHNYAITQELARALDDYAGEGPVYIKIWPYWYDGNSLKAQLRVTPQTWNGEIDQLAIGQAPLVDVQGKMLIIVHPQDKQALAVLQEYFPRGVAVSHRDFDGQVAFITFYGER